MHQRAENVPAACRGVIWCVRNLVEPLDCHALQALARATEVSLPELDERKVRNEEPSRRESDLSVNDIWLAHIQDYFVARRERLPGQLPSKVKSDGSRNVLRTVSALINAG